MKKRLWQNALLISPVIGLYATGPFYSKHNLDTGTLILFFLSITLVSLMLWSVHIYLALKHAKLNNFWKFTISYSSILLLRLIFQFLIPIDEVPEFKETNKFVYNLFLSFVPNMVILVLCNSIVTEYKRATAEKEIQELKFQNSEAQKQVLTRQLHPHFLFNALSVLKSLISSNQKKAEEYTLRLTHFLQYSIHSHKEDVVALERELKFVIDYIALQKVRFGEAFIAEIQVPRDILKQKIPVFALQTLVENIFKHNNFTEKKPLVFTIQYKDNSLVVSNRKNPANHVKRNNTGLVNLDSRYMLIANRHIKIDDSAEEFIVTIPTIA